MSVEFSYGEEHAEVIGSLIEANNKKTTVERELLVATIALQVAPLDEIDEQRRHLLNTSGRYRVALSEFYLADNQMPNFRETEQS